MYRLLIALLLAVGLCVHPAAEALAKDYTYMNAGQVKEKLDAKAPMHLVDIQVEEEFAAHHLPGAMETCAFPVKTDAERHKLDPFVDDLKKDETPVVIVCPRGQGGAERAYDYLLEKGLPASRLFILEKGQGGWPFLDYVRTK